MRYHDKYINPTDVEIWGQRTLINSRQMGKSFVNELYGKWVQILNRELTTDEIKSLYKQFGIKEDNLPDELFRL